MIKSNLQAVLEQHISDTVDSKLRHFTSGREPCGLNDFFDDATTCLSKLTDHEKDITVRSLVVAVKVLCREVDKLGDRVFDLEHGSR